LFRFAPSPNGRLHLGHAYSALLNAATAATVDGDFLLRIEDIDRARCKPEYETAIIVDLAWLGLTFGQAPRRQSAHVADYAARWRCSRRGASSIPVFACAARLPAPASELAIPKERHSIREPAAC